jgi:hypothetical protein
VDQQVHLASQDLLALKVPKVLKDLKAQLDLKVLLDHQE